MIALIAALALSAVPCPARVEYAIRANPRYAHLARPMACRFVEITAARAAAWAFTHPAGRHWYLGQAHVYRKVCGPPRYACYDARIVAFAGHRS